MGKNKQSAKTKNVFKVQTKSPAQKSKRPQTTGNVKKTKREAITKKSKEKIKQIDQQLQKLGPICTKSQKPPATKKREKELPKLNISRTNEASKLTLDNLKL